MDFKFETLIALAITLAFVLFIISRFKKESVGETISSLISYVKGGEE